MTNTHELIHNLLKLKIRLSLKATLITLFLSSSCFAAYFENLSIDDGLSQGSILSVSQDHYGFIWIGTADGLNRYDGVEIIHFKDAANDSDSTTVLTGLRIHTIVPDKGGNLWIGTRNGLNYFNTTTYEVKHFLNNPQNPKTLPHNNIDAIALDSKGVVWIATKVGLVQLNPKTEQFKLFQDIDATTSQHKCSHAVRALAIDANDNIWLGNRNNLCKFNPNTEQFELIDYRNDLQKSTTNHINHLLYHSKGYLWIGTRKGLFQYHLQSGQSVEYTHSTNHENSLPDNWVSGILEQDSDHIWIGTSNGLGQLNLTNGVFTNYRASEKNKNGLSNSQIFSLNIDKSGLILIGTNGGGLNIYNPRQQAFKHIKKDTKKDYSLSDSTAWGILKAYGYVWVGTSNGLNRFDPKTGKIKQYLHDPNNKNSLPNSNVMTLVDGYHRDLWIVTWDGMSHFTVDDERFENYLKDPDIPETYPLQNTVGVYYDKKRNHVWAGSLGQGITILNLKTKKFTLFKHDSGNSDGLRDDYAIYINQILDSIWIGTRNGITRYYPESATFNHINHDSINIGKDSSGFKALSDGSIAIASSNGLSIYNPKNDELIKHYTVKEGLDDDYIYSVEIDKQGHIWVGTNFGLSRINPKTDNITNFNILDGLQGYEFNGNSAHNDGEHLYFGGYNGVNYFKPEDINNSKYIPPIVITGFSIHNKPIENYLINKPIQLTYKDDFFSIEFAALDFTHPKKNQYAYKLEGFDKDWVYSNNRNFASYTNLDGGEYTFRIKAANKYGVWNEQGTSVAITITPPFWKTSWFRIIVIASTLLIIFSIYTLRVKAIQRRNILLKEEVKARTAELEDTLVELGETKDALVDAAHRAGMADTATGVLHNVGNIINSVNTSAGLIREIVAKSICHKLLKANQVIEKNRDNLKEFMVNNPKAETLLCYYLELGKSFKDENVLLEENASHLIKKINTITEVITAQQTYAQDHGTLEELSLQHIVDDTMLLQAASIDRHEITIKKEFDQDIPLIPIQKIKLVQILLNLYKNAKESMDANKAQKNQLSIKICRDSRHAYIKISDTGLGIAKDQFKKIFTHGYTTKEEGHGFGLHNSANHMTEMGGKMWAESDGPGHGAIFILQFPLKLEDCQDISSVA